MDQGAITAARGCDLLQLIEPDTSLNRVAGTHGGEWAGPCPFCGGRDRFHVNPYRGGGGKWYCRHCQPRGGDAIDYVQRRERCAFTAAVAYLLDRWPISRPLPPQQHPSACPGGLRDAPAPAWQASAARFATTANAQLAAPEGMAGRTYLIDRGIQPETWLAWRLGFAHVWHGQRETLAPAIALPWIAADGQIHAVQYRYIPSDAGDPLRAVRYGQRRGGHRQLFGRHLLAPLCAQSAGPATARTLILCEGELNALSLWQVAQARADVLSWGPQDNIRQLQVRTLARTLAAGYPRVIVWADAPERAQAAAAALDHPDTVFLASAGMGDANDLLRLGLLADHIACYLN